MLKYLYQREITYVHEESYMQMFLAALYIIAPTGNNPTVHQVLNCYTKCGISIECNTTQQ